MIPEKLVIDLEPLIVEHAKSKAYEIIYREHDRAAKKLSDAFEGVAQDFAKRVAEEVKRILKEESQ